MVINIGERLEALRAEGKPFPDALRPHQVEVLSILLPNKTIFSLKSLGGCYRAHFGRSSCCIEHCNGRWKVSAADGRQCFWPGYMWTQFVIFDQYKVFEISEEGKTAILILPLVALELALFDMPNLNRFDILSISIFCKIALSISISISIFSKITISISISISIFLELPYRYRYRYRYFSELPYRYRYRYRYFQLLHIDIDIDIDIFQKCRYIDNRYFISIF